MEKQFKIIWWNHGREFCGWSSKPQETIDDLKRRGMTGVHCPALGLR